MRRLIFIIMLASGCGGSGIIDGPHGKSLYLQGSFCSVNADSTTTREEFMDGLRFCEKQWDILHQPK